MDSRVKVIKGSGPPLLSMATEYAHITRVSLQNFMCHTNFDIELNPSLNVLVGTNGSGKSSILTAIMVVLGSRAKSTSRGDSIGSLVQSGKQRAWVHIEVYIPELGFSALFNRFGGKVRITRIIDSTGKTKYELRNSLNQLVKGAGISDIQSVCHHVGLFPENELAMLSQENAKEFLISSTAKTKYEKLRRALQQHAIAQDKDAIKAAQQQQAQLVDRIRIRKQNLDEVERRADETLRQHELSEVTATREKLVQKELLRREVEDLKKKRDQAEEQYQKKADEVAAVGTAEEYAEQIEETNNAISALQAAVASIEHKRDGVLQTYEQADDVYTSSVRDLARVKADRKELVSTVSKLTRSVAQVSAQKADRDPETLAKKKTELRTSISSAQGKIDRFVQQEAQLLDSKSAVQTRLDSQHAVMARLDRELADARSELAGASSASTSTVSHSRETAALLNAIKQHRSEFEHAPIGPLYAEVALNADGAPFQGALETLWTHTLDGYWVRSENDRKLLLRLGGQLRTSVRAILRQDDAFNIGDTTPPPSSRYKRAIDAVEFSSEAVARVFIDLNSAESLVFVNDVPTAFDACKHARVSQAISLPARANANYMIVSATNMKTESSSVQSNPRKRMRVEANEETRKQTQIADQQRWSHEIARIEVEIQNEQLVINQIKKEASAVAKELETVRRDLQLARKLLTQFEKELDETVYIGEDDLDARLDEHERELKNANTELLELEQALASHAQVHETNADTRNHLKSTLDAINAELKEVKNQLSAAINKARDLENEASNCEVRRERLSKVADRHNQLRREASENYTSVAASFEAFAESDPPFEAELKTYTVHKVRELLQLARAEAAKRKALKPDLDKARATKRRVEQAREEILQNELELQKLRDLVETRRRQRAQNEHTAWENVKRGIKHTYNRVLRRRNFQGGVDINDKKQTLVATAVPESDTHSKTQRAMSTLSGGEKSFTQIALLMAVWESMQVGFVSLDEYDVFMDKANRALSLRVLAETVNRHKMQCLLITPQAIETSVLSDIEYKVFKLAPARPQSN